MAPPPPPASSSSSSRPSSNSLASDLADEFDDLHFLPPTRSSPPTMKNFISSPVSSLSNSSSGSSGLGNEEMESNDFTIGTRIRKKEREDSIPQHNTNTGHSNSSRRPSNPSINRYPSSKERYVFSNFRFLVKEGSNLTKSVDESIDWLTVEMVLVPEIENVLCPICLDVPFIPRFTRCGHIYCFPCLLQFFQTSEPSIGNNWRTCPVCAELLHLKQLRPVKFCPATEPQEGEIFHSVLIKKPIGSLQPLHPKFPNDSLTSLSPFQRLIPVNEFFVIDQILNPELVQLRTEIKNRKAIGEESLELSFFESTIKQIEDQKQARSVGGSAVTAILPVVSPPDLKPAADYYYFHQSRDGLNVFLHPLCMKILKYEFESYDCIPNDLSLPILQLERVIVTSSNRKRFKYLDHLSLGTQIILVEVDLKSIVSPSTLQTHQKELSLRQGLRNQKMKSKEPRDKSILEEWKMMEDDYYSLGLAASAMDIKVPESVKLDNLDDEESFPLPSSFNNNSSSSMIKVIPMKKQSSEASPSFSALAHSWNSPFTFNSTYSGEGNLQGNKTSVKTANVNVNINVNVNANVNVNSNGTTVTNTPTNTPTSTTASAWNNEESPTLSLLSTSSTSSKKKTILLFSNGLNLQKKIEKREKKG